MITTHQPRKRFGQHFLRDPKVLQRIAHAIHAQPGQSVIEIGPGEGVLTDYLVASGCDLTLIEIDRDLAALLQQRFAAHSQVKLVNQDVLTVDFQQWHSAPHSLRVVGNLPYNISSPLLFKLFNFIALIADMYFLLQKEVVDRMTAPVGEADYNRLSVMTQYFCDNEALFDVPPEAFFPPPKVNSAVVRMVPRTPTVTALDLATLELVVRTAFNQRRKTIHNALKTLIDDKALKLLGIDPAHRPQNLSVDNYVQISNHLYALRATTLG